MYDTIGQRFKYFLDFVGKKMVTVTEETGITSSVLTKIANDATIPSGKTLITLTSLGLNVHWLLTGDGEMMRQDYAKKIINNGNNINQFGGNNNRGVTNEFNEGGDTATLQQKMKTLQVQLEAKERLIAEKERLIQVLLEKR